MKGQQAPRHPVVSTVPRPVSTVLPRPASTGHHRHSSMEPPLSKVAMELLNRAMDRLSKAMELLPISRVVTERLHRASSSRTVVVVVVVEGILPRVDREAMYGIDGVKVKTI
jgi:hypothetical protein